MKALVIYDSFFGNTEQVARAIGQALDARGNTEVVRVADAKPEQLSGTDLLIVGSPTRGFRPSPATADFLKALKSDQLRGVQVAAFDTRIALSDIKSPIFRVVVNIGGYAAKSIADKLKKAGGELVAPPEGFYVEGEQGPLKPGELERAAEWARHRV